MQVVGAVTGRILLSRLPRVLELICAAACALALALGSSGTARAAATRATQGTALRIMLQADHRVLGITTQTVARGIAQAQASLACAGAILSLGDSAAESALVTEMGDQYAMFALGRVLAAGIREETEAEALPLTAPLRLLLAENSSALTRLQMNRSCADYVRWKQNGFSERDEPAGTRLAVHASTLIAPPLLAAVAAMLPAEQRGTLEDTEHMATAHVKRLTGVVVNSLKIWILEAWFTADGHHGRSSAERSSATTARAAALSRA